MSDLTYLINYLAKENKTDSNGPIKKYVQFDDNFILNNFFLQAEGNQIFSAVYDTYLITVVLADNQSLWYKESSSDFVFYVKQTTNDGGTIIEEYHELNITSLHGFDFNSLDDTDSISEVYLSYNRFEYNTNTNKLYLFFEELQEVIFDGNEDNFYYTRDSLRNLKDGDYELNYKDSLGLNNDFWDNSVRKFRETNLNFKQRNLTLNFNEKNEGRVFKFPTISHQNILSRKITLDYNFDNQEPIIASKFINTNFAIRIDFNSYQAFLSFCNQVYFSNGVAFDLDISPKVEKHFYEGYHYLVTQLIQEAQRRTKSLALLLDILWYLPRTYILAEIGIGFLWDLLIAIIEEDDVNNRGLNKEDLVTYILSNLSEMLSPDNFLEVFLLKLVYNRDTTFKKLFEELNTDDFKSFINLFWRVWKQSSYASFDPKTNPAISNNEEGAPPLVLPYTSDKALGFYHSNAEIKFSNKQTSLKVALKIDT